jgi:hypothetical protein
MKSETPYCNVITSAGLEGDCNNDAEARELIHSCHPILLSTSACLHDPAQRIKMNHVNESCCTMPVGLEVDEHNCWRECFCRARMTLLVCPGLAGRERLKCRQASGNG